MNVEVLVFGAAAEAVRADRVCVTLAGEGPVSAGAVLRGLIEQHRALRVVGAGGEGARLAVNHSFVSPESPVRAGDEVALIALVGGG